MSMHSDLVIGVIKRIKTGMATDQDAGFVCGLISRLIYEIGDEKSANEIFSELETGMTLEEFISKMDEIISCS